MRRKDEEIGILLNQLISQQGELRAAQTLRSILEDQNGYVLTIVSNLGAHQIPQRYLRGEVFVASQGSLDFSGKARVKVQYLDILMRLRKKLMEKSWAKIFLVPTGHVTLALQLKAAVYRYTRLNTIDLFYSNGRFFDVDLDLRKYKEFNAPNDVSEGQINR